MPKISKTSKMKIKNKRVGSWSLPSGISCPGSNDAEVCKSCYAKKGMYRFPVVKSVREYNREDYHKDDWEDRMVAEVFKYDYFRWFDSGDIESPELASKIRYIIKRCPGTKFWLPTRSDKIPEIEHFLAFDDSDNDVYGASLYNSSNVAVHRSADNIGLNNEERPGVTAFVIRPEDIFEAKKQGIYVCPVTSQSTQKSCDWCTHCYTGKPVAYIIH